MIMTLDESIFPLADQLPGPEAADPYGNVLFYCQEHGWLVAGYDEAEDCIQENKCTHWTWLPYPPGYNKFG